MRFLAKWPSRAVNCENDNKAFFIILNVLLYEFQNTSLIKNHLDLIIV